MQALVNLCKNIKALTPQKVFDDLLKDRDFTEFIIDLNQRQLFNKGVDANDKILRSEFAKFGQVYAPKTIIIKEEKGQPTDRVTLNDTGQFYSTFEVKKKNGGAVITADTKKDNGDLSATWGEILGLTEDSVNQLRKLAKELIVPYLRIKLLKNV